MTESQIITKDKLRNYDVYVNSNTIETLTNKDRRDQLVARVTDPSRIVGESLAFAGIYNDIEDAAVTLTHGELKAPTSDQLSTMTPEEQNQAWAQYNLDKENRGAVKTSTADKIDNSIKDFAVATRQTVIGINHDGGLNLAGMGEGNNLVENYQRNQDGRYNTLDGRTNLSNQIQYTGNDGKNKDGVDILNNATTYSVDTNQAAMQFLVNGMSGRTDIDALLYSDAPAAGLPSDAKAVAVNNNDSNTHIVGVNIDKTDLKDQSDFITSIAEETRHTTNPEDHNANQYAAQAAYVWREENIKEGRITGQGVSTEQWRADNRNDTTINKNNVTIGSQRARDMEFRQLQLPELKIVKDNAKEYADKNEITEQQARQELTQQALLMVDDTWASQPHIQENETARAFLLDKGKDVVVEITTKEGVITEKAFQPSAETKADFYLGTYEAMDLEHPWLHDESPAFTQESYEFVGFIGKYGTADGTKLNPGLGEISSGFFTESANDGSDLYGAVKEQGWGIVGNLWNGAIDGIGNAIDTCKTGGMYCLVPDSKIHGSDADKAYLDLLLGDMDSFQNNNTNSAWGVLGTATAGTGFVVKTGLKSAANEVVDVDLDTGKKLPPVEKPDYIYVDNEIDDSIWRLDESFAKNSTVSSDNTIPVSTSKSDNLISEGGKSSGNSDVIKHESAGAEKMASTSELRGKGDFKEGFEAADKRSPGKCEYCGSTEDKIEKDHFEPLAEGKRKVNAGEITKEEAIVKYDSKDNVVNACKDCNRGSGQKHSKMPSTESGEGKFKIDPNKASDYVNEKLKLLEQEKNESDD